MSSTIRGVLGVPLQTIPDMEIPVLLNSHAGTSVPECCDSTSTTGSISVEWDTHAATGERVTSADRERIVRTAPSIEWPHAPGSISPHETNSYPRSGTNVRATSPPRVPPV